MNPLTNVKNIKKLSEQELKLGSKSSWHDEYRDSAWIFIGGLPYDLTEGDIICVFSQYGEVVNINLVRDKATGKSRGYCFLCYEDQRSTILAVDNLNSIKLIGRTLRVDHVKDYKVVKDASKLTKEMVQLVEEGCATTLLSRPATIKQEKRSPEPQPESFKAVFRDDIKIKKEPKEKDWEHKKIKKEKKSSKTKLKKRRYSSDSDSDSSSQSSKKKTRKKRYSSESDSDSSSPSSKTKSKSRQYDSDSGSNSSLRKSKKKSKKKRYSSSDSDSDSTS